MPKTHVDTNIFTSRKFHSQHKNNINYGSSTLNEIISNYRVVTVLAAEIR